MFQFFDTLFSLIEGIINFFANTTYLIIDLIENTIQGVAFATLVVSNLPVFIIPIITALISIAIIKFILSLGAR